MNPKTVIHFKKDKVDWLIRRGNKGSVFYGGFSRLLRELATLVLDKDAVISGRLEVIRKKKT